MTLQLTLLQKYSSQVTPFWYIPFIWAKQNEGITVPRVTSSSLSSSLILVMSRDTVKRPFSGRVICIIKRQAQKWKLQTVSSRVASSLATRAIWDLSNYNVISLLKLHILISFHRFSFLQSVFLSLSLSFSISFSVSFGHSKCAREYVGSCEALTSTCNGSNSSSRQ